VGAGLVVAAFPAAASGWIAGMASVTPRESVQLYELATSRQLDEAARLYRNLLPLLRFDAEPYLVQAMKYACELAGHPLGTTRPPRLPLEEAERRAVEESLVRARASEAPVLT